MQFIVKIRCDSAAFRAAAGPGEQYAEDVARRAAPEVARLLRAAADQVATFYTFPLTDRYGKQCGTGEFHDD